VRAGIGRAFRRPGIEGEQHGQQDADDRVPYEPEQPIARWYLGRKRNERHQCRLLPMSALFPDAFG
jgi:hypothetical protein